MRIRPALLCVALLGFTTANATAAPITYIDLTPGITATGTITAAGVGNPEGAVYFRFSAIAGQLITLDVDRLVGDLDPFMLVYNTTFTDTDDFAGDLNNSGNIVASGDDDTPGAIPGPFGDPFVVFNAPTTGLYTAAVTSFISAGSPPYDVAITLNPAPVPAPASLVLLGTAAFSLAGFSGWNRMRRPVLA